MSSEAAGRSTYNWTTLRYLVDPQREITIPMGVILWSEKEQQLWFRLPQEGERVPPPSGCDGVPAAQARTYLEMTRAKLEGWSTLPSGGTRLGELPYQTEPHPPLSEGWWEEVRRLLQWRVRLGPCQSLVCHDPEADLEQLYQALVQPLSVPPEPSTWLEPVPAAPAAD
jgi:hypothetical protein